MVAAARFSASAAMRVWAIPVGQAVTATSRFILIEKLRSISKDNESFVGVNEINSK
jgi:hypothetical protein